MIEMGKQYQTRDGRAVRILCVDGPGSQPVVGIIEGEDNPDTWNMDGTWSTRIDSWDLVPVPVKHEAWAVIEINYFPGMSPMFCTKEGAEHHAASCAHAVVAHVTWEE